MARNRDPVFLQMVDAMAPLFKMGRGGVVVEILKRHGAAVPSEVPRSKWRAVSADLDAALRRATMN